MRKLRLLCAAVVGLVVSSVRADWYDYASAQEQSRAQKYAADSESKNMRMLAGAIVIGGAFVGFGIWASKRK